MVGESGTRDGQGEERQECDNWRILVGRKITVLMMVG